MNAFIKPTKARCPFCPAKGNSKEQPIFSVKAEGLATVICGDHLWGFLSAQEEQAAPQNGQPAFHEFPG